MFGNKHNCCPNNSPYTYIALKKTADACVTFRTKLANGLTSLLLLSCVSKPYISVKNGVYATTKQVRGATFECRNPVQVKRIKLGQNWIKRAKSSKNQPSPISTGFNQALCKPAQAGLIQFWLSELNSNQVQFKLLRSRGEHANCILGMFPTKGKTTH